jgi:hypothetical protein
MPYPPEMGPDRVTRMLEDDLPYCTSRDPENGRRCCRKDHDSSRPGSFHTYAGLCTEDELAWDDQGKVWSPSDPDSPGYPTS